MGTGTDVNRTGGGGITAVGAKDAGAPQSAASSVVPSGGAVMTSLRSGEASSMWFAKFSTLSFPAEFRDGVWLHCVTASVLIFDVSETLEVPEVS